MGMFDKIMEKYSENVPLRWILMNTIPVFGPSLDLAMSTYAGEIYKDRIETSMDYLKNAVNRLQIDSLDKNFVKTESFFDIFRLYLEKSIRTRQKEKIEYYARLLTETIIAPDMVEQAEQAIEKISALSMSDISVMKHMYEKHLTDPEEYGDPVEISPGSKMLKKIPNNLPEITGMNKSQIELSINNLISSGLVREYSGSGSYEGGWYFVTPLLNDIMKKLTTK